MVLTQDTESPTTAPSGETPGGATDTLTAGSISVAQLLLFAGVVLAVFAVVYVLARLKQAHGLTGAASYATFARLYGLTTVAILAVLLAFSNVAAESLSAAFALLGTIAGYLAGASSPTTTTTQKPVDGGVEVTKVEGGM